MTDSQVGGQISLLLSLVETQVTVVQARLQAELDNHLLLLLHLTSSILTLVLVGLLIAGLLAGLRMLIFSVPPEIPSSFGGEATGGTGVQPVLVTPELVGHQVGDLGRFVITQITFVLQTQVNCPIVPV